MEVIKTVEEMQNLTRKAMWNRKVGFVPTMGALHKGHISLAEQAKKECSLVVMSIYVNPSQFGPNEDLDNYPRTLDADLQKANDAGVDIVFLPTDKEIYPEGYSSWVNVDGLTNVLCGASRPGHFRGVTTIVAKLMNIVKPNFMYMGEKDYQQIAVLNKMIIDLNFSTIIRSCPIIRESDGLAMSSRNKYLSKLERENALCLSNAIKQAKLLYKSGETDVAKLRFEMESIVKNADGKIDYIEFVDKETLQSKVEVDDNTRVIMAVYIGSTRLIDNSDLR